MVEMIFCPRCGLAAEVNISFCRTCGLQLDSVVEFLGKDTLGGGELTSRPNQRAIRFGIGLFMFGTFLGLVHAALRDLDLYPKEYGKIVFMAFLASGMLLLALSVLFPTQTYVRRRAGKQDVVAPERAFNTTELEPNALNPSSVQSIDLDFPAQVSTQQDRVPASVTEHTTRKLS